MADSEKTSKSGSPPPGGEPGETQEQSRREFIRKLAYVPPVLTTFLLDDTAFAKDKDDDDDDDKKGRGRGRGRTSPPGRARGRDSDIPPPPP
jgi:hypothetical protein